MRIKLMTPLGLAFVFAVLLAGLASAANGLKPSSHKGATVASTTRTVRTTSSSSTKAHHEAHDSDGDLAGNPTQHGGSVQRNHANCPLPPAASLQGNWTHGDYVSAWAATGDHVALKVAAQSSCGMPVNASGHSAGKDHPNGGRGLSHGHRHHAGKAHAKSGHASKGSAKGH
jgi:hypothetical protein